MNTNAHRSHRVTRALLASVAASALALSAARAQTPEEFRKLQSMVESLTKTVAAQDARIKELEAAKEAAPPPAAASPSQKTIEAVAAGQDVGQPSPVAYRGAMNDQQEAASRPLNFTLDPKYTGFIPVPNTPVLVKLNAKPHLDVITDNKNAGNNNRFVPAVFPLEGSPQYGGGARSTITANATQLRADVRAPELEGNFRFYYQNDFFGSGSDTGDMKYRIQHLYGQFHGFKGGFTYGVWEDPDSWPDTVDYEGPNAVIFSRRPVAQYTQVFNENWNATYGVEKADIYVDVNSGPNAGGSQFTRVPDVGMNVRYEKAGWGHLQFSTMLRDLGVRDSTGTEHHATGFGVNASATLDLGDANTVQFLGVVGEGVGGMGNDTSFLNSDAAFNAAGELEALPYWSLHFAVTHRWSDTTRSTFTYGYVNLDNTDGQSETFYHTSTYASANFIWQLRKRLSIGLEGLYGTMEARNGATSGDHIRIQLGMVYSLFD